MERVFRAYWAHKTDSDHVARPGFDVHRIAAKEIQAFLPPGRRVLSIGCGAGELFQHLELDRDRYVGVDFSPSMRREFERRHPGVRVLPGEAATFSIPEKFDFIVVNNVVQYMRPWMTMSCIRNAAEMLEEGGAVFVGNVPNRGVRRAFSHGGFDAEHRSLLRDLARAARKLVVVERSEAERIGFWYTPREIADFARGAGLECAIFGCLLYPYRFTAVLRRPR